MEEVFLVQRGADGSLRSWPLKPGLHLIGREAHCEILIEDATISREHAELIVENGSMRLVDLASRNGTFINKTRIQSAEVQVNTTVQFGRILCNISALPLVGPPEHHPPSTLPYRWNLSSPDTSSLTPRKRRVLELLLSGLAEKEIASRIGISQNTVHHHVTDLYRTFNVVSRGELLALFIRK